MEYFVYRVDFEMDHHKIKILVEDGVWKPLDDFLKESGAKLVHIVADSGTYFAILEKYPEFSTNKEFMKSKFDLFASQISNLPRWR